ncbi:MAG TPA: glutaredoxin family protein [Candidatus Nanoarchaeia archaeon]|nr:glutaredoxin family protein [Candidatus Nanoarchaeia archaeon]
MVKEQIQVLLYRTDSCIWCHKAMEWLKAHKIKFTEKKVDHDDKAAEEMIEKSGQRGVPVLDIGGKIIVGFDEPAMKKALKL